MKVVIKYFIRKHQNRVAFVKLLTEYNPEISLKPAKELLDNMLDGTPIEYEIKKEDLNQFTNQLDELNLEYEIKSG